MVSGHKNHSFHLSINYCEQFANFIMGENPALFIDNFAPADSINVRYLFQYIILCGPVEQCL
jgi:hypothetical protein